MTEVTKTEEQAVAVVLDYYGGVCNRSKGFNIENGKKETYFELDISRSKLMEQYADLLEMPVSNIAYMFYKNLGKEKSNYTHVRVKVTLRDGRSHQDEYSTKTLEEFGKFENLFYEASNQLRKLEYDDFIAHFDTVNYPELESNIKSIYSKIDSAYSPSKNSELTGFSFLQADPSRENVEMVHVAGALLFKDENIPISYFIRRRDRMISGMKFEW